MRRALSFMVLSFAATLAACSSAPDEATGSGASAGTGGGGGGGTCISCPPAGPPIAFAPSSVDFGHISVIDTTSGVRHAEVNLVAPSTALVNASFARPFGGQWSVDSITTSLGSVSGGGPIYAQAGDTVNVKFSLYPEASGVGVLNTSLVVTIGTSIALMPVKATTTLFRNRGVGIDAYLTVTQGTLDANGAYLVDAGGVGRQFRFTIVATNVGEQAGRFTIAKTAGPLGLDLFPCAGTFDLAAGQTMSRDCMADPSHVPASETINDAPFTVQIQAPTATTTYPFAVTVVPVPAPPCAPLGTSPNTNGHGGCCPNTQLWQNVCATPDDGNCGLVTTGIVRCCEHRGYACLSGAHCSSGYCIMDDAPRACSTTKHCAFDCPGSGAGTYYGDYCDTPDAQAHADNGCTVTCP